MGTATRSLTFPAISVWLLKAAPITTSTEPTLTTLATTPTSSSYRAGRANPAIIAELRSRIAALNPTCLVTAAMGSFHWIEGMTLHEQPFDFWAPGLPGHPPDPTLELIPYDMMARHCRGGIGWQLAIVKDILRFTGLPIFHIEAPPPVANMDLMLQGAASHPTTREGLEKTGAASPSFRLKVWWAWTAATREACGELGLHFIEAPPETRDAQGFPDERCFLDGVHGNAAYGALLVREVAEAKRRLGLGQRSNG